MKQLITQQHQEVEHLKVNHLNDMQREKRRIEQYYKMMPTSTIEAGNIKNLSVNGEKQSVNNTQV